jgi:ElaB/YqjD/DUF883 family membrane-anchored ribosome-binding protein
MAERNDDGKESSAAATVLAERHAEAGSDAMRRDIQTTRAAIDDKLGALQDNMQIVQAKAKQIFDVRYQIERHPWAAVGASVAAGFVAGSLGTAEAVEQDTPASTDAAGVAQHVCARPRTARRDLLGTLKLALGAALMELIRQQIHKRMPLIGEQLDKVWEGRGLTSVSVASTILGTDRPASQA